MKLSTRLALAMVALVLLTAAMVGAITYRNIAELALPRALDRIDMQARIIAIKLEGSVSSARGDVSTQGQVLQAIASANVDGGARPADGTPRERLTSRFIAELNAKPSYSQFRLVGVSDGGREIVRVDRTGPNGAVRAAPDAELQRQGDRPYFQETVKLRPGQIYVSPVDLNREHDAIDPALTPTLRVAAPIFTQAGRTFGILIVNIDLTSAFAAVRAGVQAGERVYVVNERGDYLVHPNPRLEFGFELGAAARIQDDFPETAMLLTADGEVVPRVIEARNGSRFGMGWENALLAGGTRVSVIKMQPYETLLAGARTIRDSTLLGGLAAVLGAILLAVFLARSLTRQLGQVTLAVEGVGRDRSIAVPTGATGEIGALARAFERMRMEIHDKTTALQQEIEERKRIFDTSLDLILITDTYGKFVRVSPSSTAILGYNPDEMSGHTAAEFIYPDDLEPTREEMRLARRGHHMRDFETRYVHKNGHTVSLYWSGVWSEPERRYFFIGRDMTESKAAQQALLESEQMARGIVANALDAFIQLTEHGEVLEWNPQAAAILGWSRQEAVGKLLSDLYLPKDYRPRYIDIAAQLHLAGKDAPLPTGQRFEFEAVRKDGHKIKVEVSLTALRRGDGYVFNLFLRDLTEKIAADEQLRQAQKMEAVGQLTGGIAHDFNNMLTVITGTIDILAEAVADKPQLTAIAKLISEAADRGAELTGHLLAFARKQPLQPRETDINALVNEASKLLRSVLGEQIEIDLHLRDTTWPALIDQTQLTTALLNLAVNARDAMPDGGKLTLETTNVTLDRTYAEANAGVQPGDYVLVAVSDTGNGIPETIRDKVFEPFFTTKDVGKGTGLGLSMVYGFVKQSNGHIKVYSEEGHGTTFKLYVPKAGAHAEANTGEPDSLTVESGDEIILVVEDDALVRTYVIAQLQSLGYRTLSAANAAEALAIVDGGADFDLLFTDVIIPGAFNGRQLADEIARRRQRLKVLFTSGYTENAIIHHGRLDPGVLLLAKPYRKLDLARMIRRALASPEKTSNGRAATTGVKAG